jgi:hypothetical protein
MKQMWLPVFDRPDRQYVTLVEAAAPPVADETFVPVLTGQIGLFGAITERVGEMYLHLEAGCFERAAEIRRMLIEMEGESEDTRKLAWLDVWGAATFWERSAREVLSDWRRLDAALAGNVSVRRLVRAAAIGRLLRTTDSCTLSAAEPTCLPAIVNVLSDTTRSGGDGDVRRARALVRDALLAGHSLSPMEFDDEALADLLAEDLEPAWLACLGALRGLWPCPPVENAHVVAVHATDERAGASDDAASLFWSALTVAADRSLDESLRGEARKRMKRLNPDLHAIVMRTAWLAR